MANLFSVRILEVTVATAEWKYSNAGAREIPGVKGPLQQLWVWIRKKVITLEKGSLVDLERELRQLGAREAQVPGIIEALATSEGLIVKDGVDWRLTDEKLALKKAGKL